MNHCPTTMLNNLQESAEQQKQGVALKGKHFTEAYDVETIQPTAEWQGIYEEVCREMEDMLGLKL